MWASLGIDWLKMGRSSLVRLIGRGLVIFLVGGCGFAFRSSVGLGWVWAYMGKGRQVWIYQIDQAGMVYMSIGWVLCKGGKVLMGQTDWAGIGDMSSGWLWVSMQV